MEELGKDSSILKMAKDLFVSRLQEAQREAAIKNAQPKQWERSQQQRFEESEQVRDVER